MNEELKKIIDDAVMYQHSQSAYLGSEAMKLFFVNFSPRAAQVLWQMAHPMTVRIPPIDIRQQPSINPDGTIGSVELVQDGVHMLLTRRQTRALATWLLANVKEDTE